jgi:CBS domain-containing protein
MKAWNVGRVPVVDEEGRLVGIVSRSDILAAYELPNSA